MIQSSQAFILSSRPFMESDNIMLALNQHGELLEFIAKGTQKKSKRKSHLEPLNLVQLSLRQSKKNSYLSEARCLRSHSNIKNDLKKIALSSFICEVIQKNMAQGDPHPGLFESLKDGLTYMNDKNGHYFIGVMCLTKIANALGVLGNYSQCALCHKAFKENEAMWCSTRKSLLCIDCGNQERESESFPIKYRKALEFFKKCDSREWLKIKLTEKETLTLLHYLKGVQERQSGKTLKSMDFIEMALAN